MKVHPSPLLVTLINEEQSEQVIGHGLWRRTLSEAAWVTGKATAVLIQARQLVPEITPRSSIIHNGLRVPPVLPEPLPFETPRLLCLGRLAVQKGFDQALTALALIVDRFPNIRLIIAGDGPERPALEQQVKDLGLSEVVAFTGWIAPNKVLALINTASIVIMPSRWEGHPSVALQAGIMARPVVATRVGGLQEIVVHQQTGLLVEKEDSAGLANAIAFLLEHPEMVTRMGQAARQRVQEVFSWEQCVNAYDMLYQRLFKEVRSGSSP
jgi:glycogen(starch) synthase